MLLEGDASRGSDALQSARRVGHAHAQLIEVWDWRVAVGRGCALWSTDDGVATVGEDIANA